jgi:hypothetical protein
VHDGLPATLICDSAAAALMAAGDVDAVVVGADRVVANGDTANKIGTYSLGIAAAHHGLPFFVAAPTTTLDASLPDGGAIVIEQRPPEEITHFKGQRVAADGIGVWNPCFDVVPGRLVEGIVTERGLVPRDPEGGDHAVRAFMAALGLWQPKAAKAGANGAAPGKGEAGAAVHAADNEASAGDGAGGAVVGRPLGEEGVRAYLAARPALAAHVGPPETADSWEVEVRPLLARRGLGGAAPRGPCAGLGQAAAGAGVQTLRAVNAVADPPHPQACPPSPTTPTPTQPLPHPSTRRKGACRRQHQLCLPGDRPLWWAVREGVAALRALRRRVLATQPRPLPHRGRGAAPAAPPRAGARAARVPL